MKIAIEKSGLYDVILSWFCMVFSDEQQLLSYAKKLEGLRFSEISALIGQLDETHRKHTKGVAAKVIETEYFGIPTNSSEAPDFENLGLS